MVARGVVGVVVAGRGRVVGGVVGLGAGFTVVDVEVEVEVDVDVVVGAAVVVVDATVDAGASERTNVLRRGEADAPVVHHRTLAATTAIAQRAPPAPKIRREVEPACRMRAMSVRWGPSLKKKPAR